MSRTAGHRQRTRHAGRRSAATRCASRWGAAAAAAASPTIIILVVLFFALRACGIDPLQILAGGGGGQVAAPGGGGQVTESQPAARPPTR